MTKEPPLSASAHWQHDLTQGQSIEVPPMDVLGREHWSNPSGEAVTGLHPPMNYANYSSPTRYVNTNNMGGDGPPPTTDFAEHPGSQSYHCAHPAPAVGGGSGQHFQTAPGPPRFEHNLQVAPYVPNDATISSAAPLLHNVAGPSGENLGPVHSELPPAEDLKRIARHYLQSPDSHVDKLRMRRSRSGGFKVLILLEIDDLNAAY